MSHGLLSPCELFWLITAHDFWAHSNRTCLTHPLDWVTNTTMKQSKELSIDLKKHIIDLIKSGESLGAILKQLQGPRSTVQTTVSKYRVHGTVVSLPWSGRKHKISPAAERKTDGHDSTKNHQQPSLQWIRSCWRTGVSVHSQVCFTSTWAERLPYKREGLSTDAAP